MTAIITAKEFVKKVQALEGVVIALWTEESTKVQDYDYVRRVDHAMTINEWIKCRIQKKVSGVVVRVIDGTAAAPHRARTMQSLRDSYKSKEQTTKAIKKQKKATAVKFKATSAPKGIDKAVNLDFLNRTQVH